MNVLVIESLIQLREKFVKYLELPGLFEKVIYADNPEDAVSLLRSGKFDLVLFDCLVPDKDAMDLITFIEKMNDKPIIILTTNYRYSKLKRVFDSMHVDFVFDKSIQLKEMKEAIRRVAGSSQPRK